MSKGAFMIAKKNVILFFLLSILYLNPLNAQWFGQNKVQYHPFKWHYLQSEHFDVYFYKGGYEAAIYTANMAESSYVDLKKDFKYEITKRIKIILYSSHNDFQQTNVVDAYLFEGIGGVTELYKNRVVIPFEGSYSQLKHVLHHELVHAVMNDMLYGGSIQSLVAGSVSPVPLWFSEGLAEYFSTKWDTRADMIVRDATISGYLPPIEYLNYYMAYQGGQAVFRYIAQKYGDEKIAEILHKLKGSFRFEAAIKSALGIELKELSENWQKGMKKEYWPDINDKKETKSIAQMITDHREEKNYLNISPAISPSGDKMVFLSDMNRKQSIYLWDLLENRLIDKIVEGQNSVNFEELHWLSPGTSWSPDGKKIVFAAKAGDQDALYLYDVYKRKYEQKKFNLDGIFSASWSPKGDEIAFTGTKNSASDIYIYHIKSAELTNITHSPFSDSEPNWSNDGLSIAFVSDRGNYIDGRITPNAFEMSNYNVDRTNVYITDRAGKSVKRVTNSEHRESSPVFSPDDLKLMYVSDQTGVNNIYIHHLKSDSAYPVTNLVTGAFQLSIDDKANTLAFASFAEGGWDIFTLKNPFDLPGVLVDTTEFFKRMAAETAINDLLPLKNERVVKSDSGSVKAGGEGKEYRNYVFARLGAKQKTKKPKVELDADEYKLESGHYKIHNYKIKFSPDIASGSAGYSTLWGFQGYTQLAFSDVLGNHKMHFGTNAVLDLKNSYLVAQYYYLQQRINYMFSAFHYANTYSTVSGLVRYRNYGLSALASWPFSKFTRVDFSLHWLNAQMEYLQLDIADKKVSAVLPGLQFVHDTAEWGLTGPADGFRGAVSLTHSPRYSKGNFDFTTFKADLRQYFRLADNYSLGFRLASGASVGADPQNFFLGGVSYWFNRRFSDGSGNSGSLRLDNIKNVYFSEFVTPLRGAYYYEKIGDTYGLLNMEFRFPLISYMVLGVPPIALGNIQGALFADMGTAWEYENTDKLRFVKDGRFHNLVSAYGVGARIYFFGMLWKYDVAWRYDLKKSGAPIHYISMGLDF
jgi:hypothetical protein